MQKDFFASMMNKKEVEMFNNIINILNNQFHLNVIENHTIRILDNKTTSKTKPSKWKFGHFELVFNEFTKGHHLTFVTKLDKRILSERILIEKHEIFNYIIDNNDGNYVLLYLPIRELNNIDHVISEICAILHSKRMYLKN